MKLIFHLPGDPRSPNELIALGWIYRDIPWCAPHVWERLFDMVDLADYKLLAKSIREPDSESR